MIKLVLGDCLEKIKDLEDNSIDSICTDPPYELGFMGKSWDNTGIANNVEMWSECLRVLKPGGHLLAFSGTRTYHRMASAIEDAGFEARDMIEWVYGSGFPKSLNIGKAVDKLQGNEREIVGENPNKKGRTYDSKGGFGSATLTDNGINHGVFNTKGTSEWEGWGTALKPAHEPICMARKPLGEKTVAENCLKWGTGGINIDESRVKFEKGDEPSAGNRTATFGTQETISGGDGSGGFESNNLGRFPANLIHDNSEEVRECFPDVKGATSRTATKPSNATSYSMGGEANTPIYKDNTTNASRFFRSIPEDKKSMWFNHGEADGTGVPQGPTYNDSGNASRFFKSILYYPKASKSERNRGCEVLEEKDKAGKDFRPNHAVKAELGEDGNPFGRWGKIKNNHPTVKPIALMEYLIKMVTRKGGTVLDPFMGSGSTGVACKENGFSFIGIELDPEYLKIAQARINNIPKKLI